MLVEVVVVVGVGDGVGGKSHSPSRGPSNHCIHEMKMTIRKTNTPTQIYTCITWSVREKI